jgi:hypothetical protein
LADTGQKPLTEKDLRKRLRKLKSEMEKLSRERDAKKDYANTEYYTRLFPLQEQYLQLQLELEKMTGTYLPR